MLDQVQLNTKECFFGFARNASAQALRSLLLCVSVCLGACGGASVITLEAGAGSETQVLDMGSVPQGTIPSALASDWWRGAFMQIYVRAYQDSDGDGKGDLKGFAPIIMEIYKRWDVEMPDESVKIYGGSSVIGEVIANI